jgi:hypothetical protein
MPFITVVVFIAVVFFRDLAAIIVWVVIYDWCLILFVLIDDANFHQFPPCLKHIQAKPANHLLSRSKNGTNRD